MRLQDLSIESKMKKIGWASDEKSVPKVKDEKKRVETQGFWQSCPQRGRKFFSIHLIFGVRVAEGISFKTNTKLIWYLLSLVSYSLKTRKPGTHSPVFGYNIGARCRALL